MQLLQELPGQLVHHIEELVRLAAGREVPSRACARASMVQGGVDPQLPGSADDAPEHVELGPEPFGQLPGARGLQLGTTFAGDQVQQRMRVDAVEIAGMVEIGAQEVYQALTQVGGAAVSV